MKGRASIVAVLALLLVALVVLSAWVEAYSSTDPQKAAALWPDHPSVIFASGLEQVGQSAAAGQPIDKELVERLVAAAAKAPLAPEPFLVRGVHAQVAGKSLLAGRAFLEARRRNPRSIAARYFLAGHYLKSGQARLGLDEISALTRLVPQGLGGIAPYLAAYARSPGAMGEVKSLLRRNPQLEPVLLTALAADASDARLAMALWSGRGGEEARGWQVRLLTTLVAAGRFDEAHSAWLRFTHTPARQDQLINEDFESGSLPPFGWTLASGPAGVAEPDEGKRLHILYYGREDLVLASQLMILEPGRYRMSMQVSGASSAAKTLAWTIRCLPSSSEIATMGLASPGKGGLLTVSFPVPPSTCKAQQLELAGNAPEFPEQVELTIANLRLRREGLP